jgi:hypothetical protein
VTVKITVFDVTPVLAVSVTAVLTGTILVA